jgi:hypothetical protein
VVEGTPLLRAQTRKGLEGSNPFVSATNPLISLLFPFWRQFLPCFRGLAGLAACRDATNRLSFRLFRLQSPLLTHPAPFAPRQETGN